MASIQSTTIRQQLEDLERASLSPHAALAAESKGRERAEPEHDYRTAFQRDRDRILHTKAFRRLKGKTQVFLAPEGDHYRTRLTHTLEVAQIARTAARALRLNEDLVEAIALGHDLGHTPFGHAGEQVLNERYAPGFHHYEQSLRVVTLLESTRHGQGLNLTHEVRDGILRHSTGKVILRGGAGPMAETLEGRVLSICDAIAYVSHDIDDAVRAGVIAEVDLPREALEALGGSTSERINTMVTGLIRGTEGDTVDIVPEVKGAMTELRTYLYRKVYPGEAIHGEIRKAKKILNELYTHFVEHPDDPWLPATRDDDHERTVVDFLAGMTDHYALQLYERLFFPRSRIL